MRFLSRHLWAIAVLVVAVSHMSNLKRLRAATSEDPVGRSRATRLLLGYSLFQLVPWLILGVGILSGNIDGVFAAFSPRPEDPFVTSIWAFAIAGSVLASVWILFAGGATYVSRYGAGISPQPIPVPKVRVLGYVCLVMAIAMVWWML